VRIVNCDPQPNQTKVTIKDIAELKGHLMGDPVMAIQPLSSSGDELFLFASIVK
jgi:hypothetical protein